MRSALSYLSALAMNVNCNACAGALVVQHLRLVPDFLLGGAHHRVRRARGGRSQRAPQLTNPAILPWVSAGGRVGHGALFDSRWDAPRTRRRRHNFGKTEDRSRVWV